MSDRDEEGRYVGDADEQREAFFQRRKRHLSGRCVCDPHHEMPGNCPGPSNCPYAEDQSDEG